MTKAQRVRKVLAGLSGLLGCFIMLCDTEFGFHLVALIIMFSLLLFAIRTLIYYFVMARHMVGGRASLFEGIILLDLAVFSLSMVDNPRAFIILYLLGAHGYSAVKYLLRAREARSYRDPAWMRSLAAGLINLAIAVLTAVAAFFLHSAQDLVFLYAGCLFYSACEKFVSAFRRTAIVYIQ